MSSQMDFFLKSINNIQDEVINVMLINKDKYDNLEEMITDATYEMTYKIFELMDGYYNKDLISRHIMLKSWSKIQNKVRIEEITP